MVYHKGMINERLIPTAKRVKLAAVTTTIDRAPRRDLLMRSVPKAKRVKPAKRGGIIVGTVHVYHEL